MKPITTTQVGKLERLDDISLSLSLYPGPIGILQGRIGQYTNTTLVNIATFIFYRHKCQCIDISTEAENLHLHQCGISPRLNSRFLFVRVGVDQSYTRNQADHVILKERDS